MVAVTYHFAEMSTQAGNIPLFLRDKCKLNFRNQEHIRKFL